MTVESSLEMAVRSVSNHLLLFVLQALLSKRLQLFVLRFVRLLVLLRRPSFSRNATVLLVAGVASLRPKRFRSRCVTQLSSS